MSDTATTPSETKNRIEVAVLGAEFKACRAREDERHKEILEAIKEIKTNTEEIRDRMTGRVERLEARQVWMAGAATGAGFVLCKAWDWLTGVHR